MDMTRRTPSAELKRATAEDAARSQPTFYHSQVAHSGESMLHRLVVYFVVLASPALAVSSEPCPAAVRDTVMKAHPAARLKTCKPEKDNGKLQYEVKITAEGKPLELDLTPEGLLLQTEEKVPLGTVPAAVLSGFQTKYAGTKPVAAEKQTKADGKITYEVAFERDGKRSEATFTDSGAFVEEE